MKRLPSAQIATLLLAITPIGCSSTPDTVPSASPNEPLVVFLVRHGEKAERTKDPELSATGRERAVELARILHSAEIEYIHSSDFIRTRRTAAPTAAEYGLKVQLYDPKALSALAEKMRRVGGRHLVVGHSTTTPKMVELLGGKPGSAMNGEEFDRLYIVTMSKDGVATSVMMHYGEPYDSGQDQ